MTAAAVSVTLTSKISQSDEVLFQEVGGEAVLLDLASEQYFGLNSVGTRIWELLGTHDSLQAIIDIVSSEYEVSADRLQTDLLALAQKLAEAGLIKVE